MESIISEEIGRRTMEIYLQAVGVGFSLFMLYITFTQFKRGDLTSKDFGLWGIVWVVLGFFIIFPQILDAVAGRISVQGPLQFLILMSIAFLFIVSFSIYQKMRKQERKINSLISALALKKENQEIDLEITENGKKQL
ncbi:hypothetical protein CL619_02155 [archaeon]|nr:hypothetical protein [archaeon]